MIINASNKSYWTSTNYEHFSNNLNNIYLDEIKESALDLLSFLFENGFEKYIDLKYNVSNYIECNINTSNKSVEIKIHSNKNFQIFENFLTFEETVLYLTKELEIL